MKATAKLRHLRMSPRKVRLVVDVIRGLDIKDAQNQLQFMNKRAAQPMLKLLNSAVANAENNFELKRDNLFIFEIRVDQGPVLKRWMPRAFGRASSIHKRTSHISVILDEKEKSEELKDAKTKESTFAKATVDKQKDDKKKIDKDVKIVKSLDEVKEMEKKSEVEVKDKDAKKPELEDVPAEIKDVRREGSGRGKQHLDTIRKKGKGGFLKRVFRRKSV